MEMLCYLLDIDLKDSHVHEDCEAVPWAVFKVYNSLSFPSEPLRVDHTLHRLSKEMLCVRT